MIMENKGCRGCVRHPLFLDSHVFSDIVFGGEN